MKRVSKNVTGARIDAAIDRLKAGTPQHPEVLSRLQRGLKICLPSCAALEGCFSRTLIGHKNCAFPKQRERLLLLKAPSASGRRAIELAKARAEECAQLKKDVARRDTIIAVQVLRILELEKICGVDGNTAASFRRKDRRRKG
jgi:hypothetical protein